MKTRQSLAPPPKFAGDRTLFLNPPDLTKPARLVIGAAAAAARINTDIKAEAPPAQLPANTLVLDPAVAQHLRNP